MATTDGQNLRPALVSQGDAMPHHSHDAGRFLFGEGVSDVNAETRKRRRRIYAAFREQYPALACESFVLTRDEVVVVKPKGRAGLPGRPDHIEIEGKALLKK